MEGNRLTNAGGGGAAGMTIGRRMRNRPVRNYSPGPASATTRESTAVYRERASNRASRALSAFLFSS